MHKIIDFFDKFEDKVRSMLSRQPMVYSFVGGIAVVLFWKGVWDIADMFPFMYGWPSFILSSVVLMSTGLFVSFFISDRIVLSGLLKEKKLVEKTEAEIREEENVLDIIKAKLDRIENEIKELKDKVV